MSLINALISPLKTFQDNRARKNELVELRHQKTIEGVQKAEASEFQADMVRTEGLKGTWKDEYVLILLSIPVIMCFVPGYDGYVLAGFIALDATPTWFQYMIISVFSVSAGVPLASKTVGTVKSIMGK